MQQQPSWSRLAITVRGVIQGVGFRPFVFNAARHESLGGWVLSDADAVRIEVEGDRGALDRFLDKLRHDFPPQARVDAVEVHEVPTESDSARPIAFRIRKSDGLSTPRPIVPADLATCAECLNEVNTPNEPRFRYPFTNCTNCGPRWSIIHQLPYDRPRTSMDRFTMCGRCQAEYDEPSDRRFHAQPIACPQCGPTLRLLSCDGAEQAESEEALTKAVELVCNGQVLALKGLGGFQLIVDATSEDAIQRLRQRKQRPDKPLAVLLSDVREVGKRCVVSDAEQTELASHHAPIVLLRRRFDSDAVADLAAGVAPGNPYLGVMLPYTPLHHLLITEIGRPVVCTSGNLSEEPMAITTDDARSRLGRIADAILTHNRPIVRPVDDSVARVGPAGVQLLRRARGYAPLSINLGIKVPTILAVGGHLKNTVALSLNREVVISSHIGDLDNTLSMNVHRRAIEDLVDFFHVTPDAIACDMHPDYSSTRHAEQLAARWDVPLIPVQHHHAHVASCVAENRLQGPVLGLSWDGTGFGTDATVWGGEALLCDGANLERLAHLRTFSLPGGDRASRQPRRSALGILFEILGESATHIAADWFQPAETQSLLSALSRPKLFPRTSSLGRLFDGVAALCGLSPLSVSFEGQAAMALEFVADPNVDSAYPLPLSGDGPAVVDWEPMIREIIADRARGLPVARISAQFHNALAEVAAAIAQHAGGIQVVLTGGCFQNQLLTERTRTRLLEGGVTVYTQSQVPPGDGGIALGQILIAARQMEESIDVSRNPG